ncbi:uncharacterized protein LOC143718591 [Siphateles boraxobius]|uniref:uncharacterized protein LOC143718591 n=1 Tax=Siphateles boraxobius TaxID=180520 RepID=UPI004062F0B1
MGYKPLLLLQKEGNGKKPQITSLTPRCELDPLATQHLSKMTAFYELVCAGWKASEDTVLTLTLTPCDEQGTSAEAGPESLVEEAGPEGLVEEAGPEGQVEEAGPEGPAVVTAGLLEKVGLESPAVEAECLVEKAGEIHLPKKGSTGKRKQKSEAEMDKSKKKKKKNCSYHTGLAIYPIRSALKERVRKGQTEVLIDWEPCASCGKQWTPTWEPKESFV